MCSALRVAVEYHAAPLPALTSTRKLVPAGIGSPLIFVASGPAGGAGGPPATAVYTGTATARAATTATPARAARRRRRIRRPWATIAAVGAGPEVMVASAPSTRRPRSCSSKLLTAHPLIQARGGPQLGQRPGTLGFDGADRAAQRLRHLGLGHIQPEPQHHHRPLPQRQAHQRGHQRDPVITAASHLHRGRLRHGTG